MSDAITQAIQAAQAAAAQAAAAPAATSTSTAVAVQSTNAVAMPAGKPLSMDTLSTGSINVDTWIKVKEYGILVGDVKAPQAIPKLVASIEMTDGKGFLCKQSIKAGNPAQYWATYDGVTCPGTGTWEQAIQKAASISPTARPYRAVDLPLTLLEPAMSGATELAKVGTILGHSTATTNWKNWESFYKDCAQAGLIGKTVKVEVGFEEKTNKANNVWGVLTFKLLGEVEEQE